jgi:type II restriction enzyme
MPRFNDVGTKSQQMIELIDVIWLKGKKIEAAFEVESTTSIFTGLLRMSDLALALDNSVFPLYIAVPEVRAADVTAQLSRLTFQRLGLHVRCGFFTFENLIEQSEPIMRFARDVNAINQISKRVGEISEEEF